MIRTKNLSLLAILVSLTLFTVACGETDAENQATNQNADANQNADTNQNADDATLSLEVDTASSTLTAVAGEPIEVVFIIENTGDAPSSGSVDFVVGDFTDTIGYTINAGDELSSSYTWDTTDMVAGDYTAELSIGDVTATADITLTEDEGGEEGGAFFEVSIDEDASTLEVTLGEPLVIVIIGANTGDEAAIIELSGQVALEGGAMAQLSLEQQGEGADTPVEPGQGIQIEATLPTGGENQAPAGTHTITVSSGDTEASAQLIVNPAE